MKWQCYSIAGSSFHFGRLSGSQEDSSVVFPSDSLFAALVHTAAHTLPSDAFEAWISGFAAGQPDFLLTSAFPCAGSIRFYPMPLLREHIDCQALGITLKEVKKTAFISEALFKRVLSGEPVSTVFAPDNAAPLQGKKVRVSLAEYESLPAEIKAGGQLWSAEKRPRVTLDRGTSASALFFSGHIDFAPQCGLWFALSEQKTSCIDIDALLQKLADQGIGGLRSAGFGAAVIKKDGEIELPDAGGGRWMSLSRYLPAPDEVPAVLTGETAYTLEEVGGWLYSPGIRAERRRMVHMLAEGSVLSGTGKTLYGAMADVQPDYEGTRPVGHPVWRSGYAAAVALAERQE